MSLQIETLFRDPAVVAVNIQRGPEGYVAHVRRDGCGFECAQASHSTVFNAIKEHLEPKYRPLPPEEYLPGPEDDLLV